MDTETCYVCGRGPHLPIEDHTFWSIADAHAYHNTALSNAEAAVPSMSAVETLDPREAQHMVSDGGHRLDTI